MDKSKGKYYRKSYGWRRTKNRLMKNYFKMRFDYVDRVGIDTSALKFVAFNTNNRGIGSILVMCSDWHKAAGLFHSFKLTGMAIEATPIMGTDDWYGRGSVAVGMLTDSDTYDFNNLVESKTAMILSQTQITRRYYSFHGGETGWVSTDNPPNVLNGKVYTETDALAQKGGFLWSVKFSFYVTFKNSN